MTLFRWMNLTTGLTPIRYLWAFPATAIGFCFAVPALLSGAQIRRIDGIFEVHGGFLTRLLKNGSPWMKTISAVTLGHVVLAQNHQCLDRCRPHERVHVKQYETWGPFFIPAYLIYSLIAMIRGRDPYRDNPFEREAYELTARCESIKNRR
jgi:hypothetical protein